MLEIDRRSLLATAAALVLARYVWPGRAPEDADLTEAEAKELLRNMQSKRARVGSMTDEEINLAPPALVERYDPDDRCAPLSADQLAEVARIAADLQS